MAKNLRISGTILVEKPKQISAFLGDHNFKPKKGCLGQWNQRNNIFFKMFYGEKKYVDTQSTEELIRNILTTILQ